MASDGLITEVQAFADGYAALFSHPDTSLPDNVADHAIKVSKYYRPGLTVFTEGEILRVETQSKAAKLIETEMRHNIKTGLGTSLVMHDTSIFPYSETAAVAHIKWTFYPGASSEHAGKNWTFTDIYGYRAATKYGAAGWEYIVRDQETIEMRKVVGKAFNEK